MTHIHVESRVYPRLCGGTEDAGTEEAQWRGLSPLVRGNRNHMIHFHGRWRSIPACAGEPTPARATSAPAEVYPRLCGGTGAAPWLSVCQAGLSPLVRGNLQALDQVAGPLRSIPACAGEPAGAIGAVVDGQVYPRLCGGTGSCGLPRPSARGLSPLVRGNRRHLPAYPGRVGSIPACAGEPRPHTAPSGMPGVYPRLCGGTGRPQHPGRGGMGLSPLVRGNLMWCFAISSLLRSIPACAGEPRAVVDAVRPFGVYPRLCGGTRHLRAPQLLAAGLSPLVRGNRNLEWIGTPKWGSIPACAGEPGYAV